MNRMATGDTLESIKSGYMKHGRDFHLLWRKADGSMDKISGHAERIQSHTLEILLGQDLIEDCQDQQYKWRGSKYRLTQKGRKLQEAIAALGNGSQ